MTRFCGCNFSPHHFLIFLCSSLSSPFPRFPPLFLLLISLYTCFSPNFFPLSFLRFFFPTPFSPLFFHLSLLFLCSLFCFPVADELATARRSCLELGDLPSQAFCSSPPLSPSSPGFPPSPAVPRAGPATPPGRRRAASGRGAPSTRAQRGVVAELRSGSWLSCGGCTWGILVDVGCSWLMLADVG